MSEEVKIEFSSVRREVQETERSLDKLFDAVSRLNRGKLNGIQAELERLAEKTAFRKLADEAQTSMDKILVIMGSTSRKLPNDLAAALEQAKVEVSQKLTQMQAGLKTYAAERQKIEQGIVAATVANGTALAEAEGRNFSNIRTLRERHLKAASATSMSLDETRALLGMPSRDSMKTFAAQLKAQMLSEIVLDKTNSKQAWVDRTFENALTPKPFKPVNREDIDPVNQMSSALKRLTVDGNDVHSMARGLASGFNMLWLTWGNLAPLFAGAAFSYGVKGVLSLGSAVGHTMSTIRVLSNESSESVAALTDQLISLAKTGPMGPKDIAEAMKTMSLAGLNVKEVSSAIKDVMNFSVAGDTDLKTAADVMTSVATAFGIAANGYNYVGDVISKTAAISKSSVSSIGEAFKASSVLYKQYGVTLEDVGLGLAALSNLGIQGSAAGTALRNMYVDLSGRTPKVQKVLQELKLELREDSGAFKDLITITEDLGKALENYSGKASKNILKTTFSERGGKPAIELLDLATARAKEFGTTWATELQRLRSEIENSEGFMSQAAAAMALTPLNQMKSVVSTLQATMVEAFNGMEPVILSTSERLKGLFNSPEFSAGLTSAVNLVGDFVNSLITLTEFVVKHANALAFAATAYAGLRVSLALSTAAALSDTTATLANTEAKLANGLAGAGAAGMLARAIPFVGTALTIATGAWIAYDMIMSSNKRTAQGYTESGYTDKLVKNLEAETERLNENTAAMQLNMSVDQLRARKAIELEKGDAQAKVAALRKQISSMEASLDNTGIGSQEEQDAQNRTSALLTIKRNELSKALVEVAVEAQRIDKAISDNTAAAAASKAAVKDEMRRRREELKALQGELDFSAKKPPKTPKTKAESLTSEPAVKDNIAAIQRLTDAELQAEQSKDDTLRKLLDSQHTNHVISEGTYQAQLINLLDESTKKQIAISKAGNEKLEVGYQENWRLETERSERKMRDIQNSGASEEKKSAEILAENRHLQSELDSLAARKEAAVAKNEMHIQKITDDSYLRRTEAAYNYYGIIYKLTEETRLAQEKSERAIENSKASAALARRYDMVTDSTMTAIIAEKAAAEASLAAVQSQAEEVAKLADQYKKAKQALEDFARANESGLANKSAGSLTQYQGLKDVADAANKALEARRTQGAVDVTNAASNAYNNVIDKDVARLKQSTAEALTSAIVDGGKVGSKKLRDILSAELRKPIRMLIDVAVNNMYGSLFGTPGKDGSSGSTGMVSQGFSLLGVGGSTTGISGLMGTEFGAGLTTGFQSTMAGEGLAAGMELGSGLVGSGATMGGMGAMIGAAGPYIAAALAVYAIASEMQGGETRTGSSYNLNKQGLAFRSQGAEYNKTLDDAAKTQTDATVSAINSLLSAFGSNAKVGDWMSGFESSTQGKAFAYAGGTINGKAFGEPDISMKTLTGNMTPEEALAAYATDLQHSVLEALKVADLGGKIGEYINALGDIEALTQEQTTLAMKEVNDFQAFTTALKKAPFAYLHDVSVKTAAALATAAGSIANLTSAVVNYYDLFTSASQKNIDMASELNTEFLKLNVSMPDATTSIRDWYKSTVAAAGAQDLSVDTNAKAYYSLLQLATAVNTVSTAAEDAAKVRLNWQNQLDVLLGTKTEAQISLENDLVDVRDAATIALIKAVYAEKQIKDAYDKKVTATKAAFDRSAAAERTRLEALQTAAQTAVDTFTSLFDLLKSNADALYSQVGLGASSANSGNAVIDAALASGVFPDKTVLEQAITAARQGIDAGVYATQADADFAKLVLANKLATLEERAKGSLDTATLQLNAAKDQLTKLDEMVTYAGKLVDIANGIDTSIVDLSTALSTLLGLSATPGGKTPAAATATGTSSFAGVQGSGSAASGRGAGGFYQDVNLGNGWFQKPITSVSDISRYSDMQSSISNLLGSGAGLTDLASLAKSKDWSMSDLSTASGYNYVDVQSAFAAAGIPAFAGGGMHTGGLRLVGENGPELEVTGPARYYDAGTTAGMIGGGMSAETEQAIQAMAEEIAQLRRDNIKMLEKFTVVSDAFSGRQRTPLMTTPG